MLYAFLILASILFTQGCATTEGYNPVTSATHQTLLLNESSFSQLKIGMNVSQVHLIMGDSIVVGYVYQQPVTDADGLNELSPSDYKPLTIANPYKQENIKTLEGDFHIEFFVNSIEQSDGIVSDEELVPLIFKKDLLIAKGWDYLKALRLKSSS